MKYAYLFIFLVCISACKKEETLFKKLSSSHTGIRFINEITTTDTLNAFNFINFYNGVGVGIADFNKDGLPDICMVANQKNPILYQNHGKMKFDEVVPSGLFNGGWVNGISIVDINQDGWPDIYLSTAKHIAFRNTKNLLFINQKTKSPTFKEEANKYGLDYDGYSTQTVFFDHDNDGDLDAYMLNTNPNVMDPNTYRRSINDGSFPTTDRLYENMGRDSIGQFRYQDISKKAGITYEGLGLGVALADFNDDGFTDIYCSNDFISDDLLYINQGNGTYKNEAKRTMKHTSLFGMGVDAADFNNDDKIDIMQLDMMPDRNERRKMMIMRNDYDRKNLTLSSQYDYTLQYMRNTLQVNLGVRDTLPLFSEQSLMNNVAATDWSWGVLFGDYDNDGWKDIFISNGYRKNVTDLDFINFHQSGETARNRRMTTTELLDIVPEIKLRNFAFKNSRGKGFEDKSSNWGLDELSYSNGVAHSDLDLDGDLDLVVNNIDEEAFVYENTIKNSNSISMTFIGEGNNIDGFGSEVSIYQNDKKQTYVNFPSRGYLSSMLTPIIVGLGESAKIDSLIVKWQSGRVQKIKSIINNNIVLKESDARSNGLKKNDQFAYFKFLSSPIDYQHEESSFIDFHTTPTLQKMISRNGPVLIKGFIDQDTLEDIVVGGAVFGSPTAIFFQNKNGSFSKPYILNTELLEVGDIAILDANDDKRNDIVIGSGIADKPLGKNESFAPMVFINEGNRAFSKENIFPSVTVSTEKILVHDLDENGYQDILFTGSYILGQYPKSAPPSILLNFGKGVWKSKSDNKLFQEPIKDIKLSDIDKDGDVDILYTGHWLGLNILLNENNTYIPKLNNIPKGWWNSILPVDIDNDGDEDLVLGNEGLNSYFKASNQEPVSLYSKDFNSDGILDPIYAQYVYKEPHVYHPLGTLTEQSVHFKKRFNNFTSYAKANFYDVLKIKELKDATMNTAHDLKSCFAINDGKGNYTVKELPFEVQSSPVLTMLNYDVNNDGYQDIILAGNFYHNDAVQGRSDASNGHLLMNDKMGNFSFANIDKSGLQLDGDVRAVVMMKNTKTIYFTRNAGKVGAMRLQ